MANNSEDRNNDKVSELEKRVRFWQQESARSMRLYAMLQEEMIQFEDRYDRLAEELAALKKRYDAE